MESSKHLYAGEAQLAGWSDSHTGGAKVTLWLPDADCLDPFRGLTVRKGNTAGHVLMVVMVEVDNAGQPVTQPEQQRLSAAAAAMCRNTDFWRWCAEVFAVSIDSPKECADLVRKTLGIESRAELDTDPRVAAEFHRLFRRPFAESTGVE